MTWFEQLAYAIARGVARGMADAAVEALERSHKAVEEATNDADKARAVRAAAVVRHWMRATGTP